MHRHHPANFMEAYPAASTAPDAPGAFVMCPVVLLQACPLHQCLCQNLYQMAYQQALQHLAPPRRPRFSWN